MKLLDGLQGWFRRRTLPAGLVNDQPRMPAPLLEELQRRLQRRARKEPQVSARKRRRAPARMQRRYRSSVTVWSSARTARLSQMPLPAQSPLPRRVLRRRRGCRAQRASQPRAPLRRQERLSLLPDPGIVHSIS